MPVIERTVDKNSDPLRSVTPWRMSWAQAVQEPVPGESLASARRSTTGSTTIFCSPKASF